MPAKSMYPKKLGIRIPVMPKLRKEQWARRNRSSTPAKGTDHAHVIKAPSNAGAADADFEPEISTKSAGK
jgi:hypothetical protein